MEAKIDGLAEIMHRQEGFCRATHEGIDAQLANGRARIVALEQRDIELVERTVGTESRLALWAKIAAVVVAGGGAGGGLTMLLRHLL